MPLTGGGNPPRENRMVRRKKPDTLSETEMVAFLRDAERLHATICRPLISPQGDHYRALLDLNQAISTAVRAVTGLEPEWIGRSSSGRLAKAADQGSSQMSSSVA